MTKKRGLLVGIAGGGGQLTGPSGTYKVAIEADTSCSAACPAGVDIKAYVNLIADRRYEDAVQVVRRANPFPGICGRVCTHPCEAECGRKDLGGPVSIRALKRFAADYELSRKKPSEAPERGRPERIAVVGAGPAGLTAAADLALDGFNVTVFDSAKEAGGLMSWGIPDFRLPKNIVRSEVRDIAALGVEIVTGTSVDDPASLLGDGFSAVVLAAGCQAPMLAGIPGEDSEHVIDCLDFLRAVSEGKAPKLGARTVVVGGGNAAMDSARTALRLGSKVTLAYRRTEEQMPADAEEVAHAREEGVAFEFLAIPVEVATGKMRFQRAKLGEKDASGRRSPVPIPGEFLELQADTVIMALGSRPDASWLPDGMSLAKGLPVLDGNAMTSVKGLFAAGDLATGPSTIVDAIGSGHDAAIGVVRFLAGTGLQAEKPAGMLTIEAPNPPEEQRCASCFLPMENRRSTFDEAELGMGERAAIAEAQRCRRCGPCDVCDVCLAVCDYRNAAVSAGNETVIAKVPFEVAREALEHPGGWVIKAGSEVTDVSIVPYLAVSNSDKCIACGKCEDACPYKAIRTVFDTEGNARAEVELSACRGCGACAAACPTGAISIGHSEESGLFGEIAAAVKASAKNGHVVTFSCIWGADSPKPEPWDVRLQCTRRASPAMIVQALAMGAKAVAVVGCEDDECHYLPGPWMGPDVVEACKEILGAIGVDPARVSYIGSDDSREEALGAAAHLKPFKQMAGKMPAAAGGLGRSLDAVQVLMAQPDTEIEAGKAGALLGMGCLALSEPAFIAYRIQKDYAMDAILELLEKSGLDMEVADGLHTPGAKLKEWGMDQLHKAYVANVARIIGQAKTLAVATPKAYEGFAKMSLGCKVETLPAVLRAALAGRFSESPMTVTYHPACSGGGQFDSDCLALLGDMPGLKVVALEGKCGDSGWAAADAGSGKAAVALLKAAEAAGATVLVAGSTRCAAHLRAVTGGWCTTPVKVVDIYSYTISRLRGDA